MRLATVFPFIIISVMALDSQTIWLNQLEVLRATIRRNESLIDPEAQANKTVGISDFNITMECDSRPTSVHQLRPQDIDVIGAMGDSITAASGASADYIPGVLFVNPGLSWSVGGEGTMEDTLTVANILREFNPKLKGYSLGIGATRDDRWFNVAIPGARASDMEDQAWNLVNKMRNDSRVDFENDWKLITIFIGGNDLCALKRNPISSSPIAYRNNVETALDILHMELPRTLINIVEIMEISHIPEIVTGYGANPRCGYMQRIFCQYVATANETDLQYIDEQNHLYQDGQVDATFFAPDCFHFSAKGHAMGAVNIWNNMLEPVGQKSTEWTISDLKCPTKEAPYIYTRLNSGIQGTATSTTTPDPIVTSSGVTSTTTTTSKPAQVLTTTTAAYVPQQCMQSTPEWVVVVICVLSATVLIQTAALFVTLCQTKSKRRRISATSSEDSFRSHTKM